jgi:hypothetical protein
MVIAIFPILLLALLAGVLVAGATLIIIGFRGRALWSSPYCVTCKYDLRGRVPEDSPTCPECGADLTHPKAVGFVRQGRRPKLIWLGVCVLIAPFVLAAGLSVIVYFYASSVRQPIHTGNLSAQTNTAVLTYVQNNINQPWGWDELADRIRAGTLSAAEAEQALGDLTKHMVSQKPNGWDSPMHGPDGFLEAGGQAGLFSDQVLFDFADAYHGKDARIDRLQRLRLNQTDLYLYVQFGSHWEMSQHAGMQVDLLWAIEEVTIGGEPMAFHIQNPQRNTSSAVVDVSGLTPGDHELVVKLDAAYIESSRLIGFNRQKSSPDDWPQALRRWPVSVKRTLTVYGEDDQPVGLSTDAALKPPPDTVTVKHLVVQPEQGGHRVALELELADGYIGALSYDISIDLAGQRHGMKSMFYIGRQNGRSYNNEEQSILLDELDPSVTTADVVLTPNPRYVYHRSEVDEVWGEPIVIKDVPIKRFDLRETDDGPEGD